MNDFPKHITFVSDGTQVEFVNEIKGAKIVDRVANYSFTKSTVNLGVTISLFLSQIERLFKDKLITINDTTNS